MRNYEALCIPEQSAKIAKKRANAQTLKQVNGEKSQFRPPLLQAVLCKRVSILPKLNTACNIHVILRA